MTVSHRGLSTPVLRVIAGPNVGQVYEIDADEVSLGRDVDGCAIVLGHAAVSREHARILRVNGGFEIEDLDSRNGTLVNGEPVARAPLEEGDVIKICGFQLVFEVRRWDDIEADKADGETRAQADDGTEWGRRGEDTKDEPTDSSDDETRP